MQENKKYGIVLKNDKINELLKKNDDYFQNNQFSNNDYAKNMTYQEMGEFLLSGYWGSLLDSANVLKEEYRIDFSYNTLKNLPIVLKEFLKITKENDSPETIEGTLIRTIAAYWYGLAMNENNSEIKVRVGNGKNPPYWSDMFSIKIGNLKEENFLIIATEIFDKKFEVENKVFINMTPLIKSYNEAFGIDLSKYEVYNFVI